MQRASGEAGFEVDSVIPIRTPMPHKLPFGFEEGEQYVSIVLKHRLRDKSGSSLNRMARKVNFV
jgi:hypothetical protein